MFYVLLYTQALSKFPEFDFVVCFVRFPEKFVVCPASKEMHDKIC